MGARDDTGVTGVTVMQLPAAGVQRPRSRGERGAALIAVLVVVAALGVLTAGVFAIAANGYKASTWARDRVKALYAAEAGINRWLFLYDSDGVPRSNLSGDIDGINYTVTYTRDPGDASKYLLRSSASTGGRTCTVSIEARSSPEAWQHVIFAGGNFNPPRLENVDPASGPNGPVTGLSPLDVPRPDWGAYRSLLEPDISWATPNVPPYSGNFGTVTPVGAGPHYYAGANIDLILGPITGDLYLSGCNVRKGIVGPIFGNIFIRASNINGPITGQISGSICIEGGNVSGIGDAGTVIDGDIKISGGNLIGFGGPGGPGRGAHGGGGAGAGGGVGGIEGEIKGNVYLDGGNSVVVGATVDGSLYAKGNTTLSDGSTIRGGVFTEGNLHLRGDVTVGHRENLPAIMAQGNVNIQEGQHGTLSVNGVVWVDGNFIKGGGTLVLERGNLVTKGNANLTGNGRYKINYDYGLLDPENQPPYFSGGKTTFAVLRDTWTSSYGFAR
ncbi:MAG TPA: hypothetical protein GXX51_06485 [Firmicutes bacterium]|nr:hypothetical protein [Bacillota bacterium]